MIHMCLLYPARGEEVDMKDTTRQAKLAGAWYPGEPDVLRAEIEGYLGNVPALEREGAPVAIVSPHAGLPYSGQVAAYAYKAASGASYESIIVIGPSHRARFRGAVIYNGDGYRTPLGVLALDRALAEHIVALSDGVSFAPDDGLPENSIEIQAPFLQVLFPGTPFVPILMGVQDGRTCDALAEAVVKASMGRRVLVVASSDLSHYHHYNEAVSMDATALSYMEKMDVDGFYDALEGGRIEACGAGPVRVALRIARTLGCGGGCVLKYANSGDVTGDRAAVVGYAAVAFYKGGKDEKKEDQASSSKKERLSEKEKKKLIEIARKSIEGSLEGQRLISPAEGSGPMKAARGAFVTLKKGDRLRGCIGFIEPKKPLDRTIAEMARAAAFNDPRFPPLKSDELNEIRIEISALTPLRRIKDVSEIEVGRDGIYIVKGFHSGLLLPQVAEEHRWDRTTFLEQTCFKAGLTPDAWKERDTKIFVFSAEIFGEEP